MIMSYQTRKLFSRNAPGYTANLAEVRTTLDVNVAYIF